MNQIKLSFTIWLEQNEVEEAARIAMRPKMSDLQQTHTSIGIGDMVELGTETQHEGEPTPKYGVVTRVAIQKVEIMSFATSKTHLVPTKQLYHYTDKFQVPGSDVTLTSQQQHEIQTYRDDLKRTPNADNLWLYRTERQRKMELRRANNEQEHQQKRLARYRTAASLPGSSQPPDVSRLDIQRIRDLLSPGVTPSSATPSGLAALLGQQDEPELGDKPRMSGPLARFQKTRHSSPLSGLL